MKTTKIIFSVAFSAALLAVAVPPLRADDMTVIDVTHELQNAGLNITNLTALEVGGVVVLRGQTDDASQAQRAGAMLQSFGYSRVANLIEVITAPDDAAIARLAERRLSMAAALDGCKLRVDSKKGVVTLAGRIHSDLQRQLAVDLIRDMDGVSAVKDNLQTR